MRLTENMENNDASISLYKKFENSFEHLLFDQLTQEDGKTGRKIRTLLARKSEHSEGKAALVKGNCQAVLPTNSPLD